MGAPPAPSLVFRAGTAQEQVGSPDLFGDLGDAGSTRLLRTTLLENLFCSMLSQKERD